MKLNIPEIGELEFDQKELPVFYQSSSSVEDVFEYKKCNFLDRDVNGHNVLLCSGDIGVALADYLTKYVIKKDFIKDIKSLFSPDVDLWFYLAWGCASSEYAALPDWMHDIVSILKNDHKIAECPTERGAVYALIDFPQYEKDGFSEELVDEIRAACRKSFLNFLEESYDTSSGVWMSLSEGMGPWGDEILHEYFRN